MHRIICDDSRSSDPVSWGFPPWAPAPDRPLERTLYASLWHCAPCERGVRVYARLAALVTGEMRADCPHCGRRMRQDMRGVSASRLERPATLGIGARTSARVTAWSA